MGILAWIILGAIAGLIANLLTGSRLGIIGTILLGIVGAIVGGWLAGSVLNVADVTGLNLTSIIVAVFGAVVFIVVARALTGRRAY